MTDFPRYERAIGINPERALLRPDVPEVADIGPVLQNVSRTLLAEQEDRARERAQEQAVQDAARSELARDPATGALMRPDRPAGGTAYLTAYDRAMRVRHAGEVTGDAQLELDRIAAQELMNPEQGLERMQQYSEGVLQNLPDDIRIEVDQTLTREIAERFRGISHRRATTDYQSNVQGLQQLYSAQVSRGLALLDVGGDEGRRAAAAAFDEAGQTQQRLLDLGELGRDGAIGQAMDARTRSSAVMRNTQARESSEQLFSRWSELDEAGLTRLAEWGMGIPSEGQVLGMTFEQFNAGFPGPEGTAFRRSIASYADGRVQRILAERHRQEALAQAERLAEAERTATADALRNNANGERRFSAEEERALDAMYLQQQGGPGVNPDQYMRQPQGRTRALGFVAQTGYLPAPVRNWIRTRLYSDDAVQVSEFLTQLRQTVDNQGVSSGLLNYNALPEDVRSAHMLIETNQRLGIAPGETLIQLTRMQQGGQNTISTLHQLYPDRQGRPSEGVYQMQRDTLIRQSLGMRGGLVPEALRGDFDRAMLTASRASGERPEIERMAMADLRRNWVNDGLYVGGVGPRALVERTQAAGLTGADYDQVFLRGRTGVPPEVSFDSRASLIARLEPTDTASGRGLGRFIVRIQYRDGRVYGRPYPVDADREMMPRIRAGMQRRAQQGLQVGREVWSRTLERDPSGDSSMQAAPPPR